MENPKTDIKCEGCGVVYSRNVKPQSNGKFYKGSNICPKCKTKN